MCDPDDHARCHCFLGSCDPNVDARLRHARSTHSTTALDFESVVGHKPVRTTLVHRMLFRDLSVSVAVALTCLRLAVLGCAQPFVFFVCVWEHNRYYI